MVPDSEATRAETTGEREKQKGEREKQKQMRRGREGGKLKREVGGIREQEEVRYQKWLGRLRTNVQIGMEE